MEEDGTRDSDVVGSVFGSLGFGVRGWGAEVGAILWVEGEEVESVGLEEGDYGLVDCGGE